ncbi:hypothetical protein AB0N59_03695 [Microbacterium sp. NPDC089321]|uniref:hypothetical protein n=1 Tax=Microbacterium sp. NPDC089321 TaxID=3155183 RepID=UPI0034135D6D
MSRRPIALAALLLVVVPLSSACAGGNGADAEEAGATSAQVKAVAEEAGSNGYSELEAMLEDGKVTKGEYWQGIQNLKGCVEGRGLGFSEPQLSPVTGITYEFTINGNGRSEEQVSAELTECEDRYFGSGFLEQAYRETHAQVMDPALRSAVVACMAKAGEAGNADAANLAEIAPLDDGDRTRRDVAVKCAMEEGLRLFPELQTISIAG